MADERSWRTVLPFLVGLACFALLGLLDHVRDFALWRNYALSGLFLGSPATWALWHFDVRLPHYIQWIIVAGLLLHYGGGSVGSPDPYSMGIAGMHGINGAYHAHSWWDHLTHAVGIGAGAMGIAYLAELYQLRRGLGWNGPAVGAFAFAAGLAAGVAVELYEYLGKTVFQTIDQGGYQNTMADLLYNLLGAGLGAGIAASVNRRSAWRRIRARALPSLDTHLPWHRRVPPTMAGFIAFVTIPAAASLALGIRFLATGRHQESVALYDASLTTLVQSALWGMVAGVAVAIAAREVERRRAREAAA